MAAHLLIVIIVMIKSMLFYHKNNHDHKSDHGRYNHDDHLTGSGWLLMVTLS